MVNGVAKDGKWNFPPKLEDFDLMEIDIDPTELELLFADERCVTKSCDGHMIVM